MTQTVRFVHSLFSGKRDPARDRTFPGARIAVAASGAEQTAGFLRQAALGDADPKVLLNPDTSSPYTRVPEDLLARLLDALTDGPAHVLLEQGRASREVERRLLDALPAGKRRRVTVVPATLPLDAYAALLDACDVFVTGDGGPLHLAAARKRGAGGSWTPRNRTAVLSIFGATPSRVYGYGSGQAGYLPANQDAPSRAWDAESPCRTFAHINKGAIACEDARCFFRRLDIDAIVAAARAWCEAAVGAPDPARSAGAVPAA
jgi:hypothetical protein